MSSRVPCEPGVNAVRFVLMFTVIVAHGWWFAGSAPSGDPKMYFLMIGQGSIPVFFIISGYLLRWQEGSPFGVTRWVAQKLVPVYLLWAFLYALGAWLAGLRPLFDPLGVLGFTAVTPHLWFLPALAIAVSVTSLSLRFLGVRQTWLIAGALAAIGLFNGTYQLVLGFESNPLRANLLTAPLLVLIGIYLRTTPTPTRPVLLGIAVLAGYYLQLIDDRYLLSMPAYSTDRKIGITLATFAYALAIFQFARSLPAARPLRWLEARKDYLLVIYCVHPMVLYAIGQVYTGRSFASLLVVVAITYAASAGAAVLVGSIHRRLSEGRKVRHARLITAETHG